MKLCCTCGTPLRALSILFLLILSVNSQSDAQQRPPPDSLVRDSLRRAGADSAQAAGDSLSPPPVLARIATGFAASPALAVWEWTAEDLSREGALTLTDLLQRIPGATPFRAGLYLQPEIASAQGQTRGRIIVLLDGYELDPLTESTVDLARIELATIRHVRVERRLDVTRIELTSLEPTDARTQSRVEAGVGEPNANLFRGFLLAPKFVLGPFGFAIERIDTDGFRGRQPADVFAGWLKWGWIRERGGIQAEFRQNGLTRGQGSLWPGDAKRRDLIVRGRMQLRPGWVGELFAGHSTFENDTITALAPGDSTPPAIPHDDVLQWGARTSYESESVWANASVRSRDNIRLPALQMDGQLGLRSDRIGTVIGAFSWSDWRDAGSALSFNGRAQARPWNGLTGFAEIAGGKRGGPIAYPGDSAVVDLSGRNGLRLGLGLQRWGIQGSAAFIRFDGDSLRTFGLPFDSTDQRFSSGPVSGVELTWSVPLYFRALTLQGHYTTYRESALPLYVPRVSWLSGVQLHTSPLRSGNLEILGRLELRYRGQTVVPQLTETGEGWESAVLPDYTTLGAYLQIRVMDVRLFIRADNLRNSAVPELPGVTLQTPVLMYGVKWNFWN